MPGRNALTQSMSLEDFSSIKAGSIVELDTYAGEPVSLCASGEVIAKGEVVVVDDYFGIRVSEVRGDDDG